MKHLKIYEENLDEPQIGDYVFCKDFSKTNPGREDYKMFKNFLLENAGKIVDTGATHEFFVIFNVSELNYDLLKYAFFTTDRPMIRGMKYKFIESTDENGKKKLYTNVTSFTREEIIFHSSNKSSVENYIDTFDIARKYNLL